MNRYMWILFYFQHCHRPFSQSSTTLHKLKLEYEKLAQDEVSEGDDVYFSGLLNSINSVLDSVNAKDEL